MSENKAPAPERPEGLRITKVYTRTGDAGATGLAGGQRVPKHSRRVEAYGRVDEFGAALGMARSVLAQEKGSFAEAADAERFEACLAWVQNLLFTIGGELATLPADRHPSMPVSSAGHVADLERLCDRFNAPLPPLTDFVLPGGGSRTAAALHFARTACRSAERAASLLAEGEDLGEHLLAALNRMSDALFIMARWADWTLGQKETIWRRGLELPSLDG